MSPAFETAAWVAGIWTAIAIVAAASWARTRRQQRRTALVHAQRARRLAEFKDINRRLAANDEASRHLALWAAEFEQQKEDE